MIKEYIQISSFKNTLIKRKKYKHKTKLKNYGKGIINTTNNNYIIIRKNKNPPWEKNNSPLRWDIKL